MTIIIPNPTSPGGLAPSTAEMRAQRAITRAFIARLPLVVTLVPRAKVPKPAGGFVWGDGTPRAPQTMTLIEPSGMPYPTVTTDGVSRVVEFELLGEWDSAMARNDVFTHLGKEWQLVELLHENGYERRALVSARG